MVVLTIGEASVIPSIPALVNELTPVAVKGKYQGLTNAFSSIGRAIGPLVGGVIIDFTSYGMLFILCTIACVAIIIGSEIVSRYARNKVTKYSE